MEITSEEQLREQCGLAKLRAIQKQLDYIDEHIHRFITLSPFLVLSTSSNRMEMDSSPRGGAPGFVKVLDPKTLLMPDAIGNNRLDSYRNIIENQQVGMLFLIPGVDETVRVNGTAIISTDSSFLEQFVDLRKPPKVVLVIQVREAFLHCAKALMRSKLWANDFKIDRKHLPTMGDMLKDQTNNQDIAESQEAMLARYQQEL